MAQARWELTKRNEKAENGRNITTGSLMKERETKCSLRKQNFLAFHGRKIIKKKFDKTITA